MIQQRVSCANFVAPLRIGAGAGVHARSDGIPEPIVPGGGRGSAAGFADTGHFRYFDAKRHGQPGAYTLVLEPGGDRDGDVGPEPDVLDLVRSGAAEAGARTFSGGRRVVSSRGTDYGGGRNSPAPSG